MKAALTWLLVATILLTACGEAERQVVAPKAAPITRDAVGRYCQMIVADHHGPKAQIFLDDGSAPIWFSSVRDGIAFTRLPEEPKNISAFYVNDMSDTAWEQPDDSTWIAAEGAWFVLDSSRSGGMGAPEAVPFASAPAAEAFAANYGGEVVRLADIPHDYVLGEIATPASQAQGHGPDQGDMPMMADMKVVQPVEPTAGHAHEARQH